METSIFTNKAKMPDNEQLGAALDNLFKVWMSIKEYAVRAYPKATEEWNFSGQKYGWSFRIKDKKRAIIYLLPRDSYFLVAFVFGEKATTDAYGSTLSTEIKESIAGARVYAEGRGFRIEVRTDANLEDIKKLIDIKLRF
jgi:hypothetical protein